MAEMVYFTSYVDPETGDVRCKRVTLTFDPAVMGRYARTNVPTDPALAEFYEPDKESSDAEAD